MKYVTIKEIDGITVVQPRGSLGGLVGGEETDALDAVLRKLDEEKAQRVIVDLGNINFMSTMPIAVLVAAHKHFVERGAHIVLCNLSAQIRQTFVIIKLSLVFWTCGTLREAVAALREVGDGKRPEDLESEEEPGVAASKQDEN